MKANVNKPKKEKREHVKIGDKFANAMFSQIIDALVKRYDESEEKKTMSFKAYCVRLRDLSNKNVGKEVTTEIDSADEEYQNSLENIEKGENE